LLKRHPRLFLVLLLAAMEAVAAFRQFHPPPDRISGGGADGAATLAPATVQAAAIGDYELAYVVGASGIAAGGGLLIEFPKSWFTNPYPIVKAVQKDDSSKPHFVTASTTRAGSTVALALDKRSFAGKVERFNWTMTVTNGGEPLRAGDAVRVVLRRTTAPYVDGRDRVRVAVDSAGAGSFREIDGGAPYQVRPGPAVDIALVAPSDVAVGRTTPLYVTAFDKFWNVTPLPAPGSVTGLGASLPITADAGGAAVVEWTPRRAGFYFPDARLTRAQGATPLSVHGNPIRVWDAEPATHLYWGDLHAHSDVSKDGIGHDPFAYARDATHLDFFAETEHADDDGPRGGSEGIRPDEWEALKSQVRAFYSPGRFVTLLAYECSLPAPFGHHNVFFRSLDGFPWSASDMKSVQALWSHLQDGEAFTIPHHMGISWQDDLKPQAGPELQQVTRSTKPAGAGPQVDWSNQDPVKRPLLEIYSLHGQSEMFAPDDALSYENAHFTWGVSTPGAHYARDAWAAGLLLGTVAASDNHTAQPGQPEGGLTAVRAPALSREAIFDAVRDKRTYATTGQRVYLEFSAAGGAGSVTLAAPSPIRFAEVVRLDRATKAYSVAARWNAPGKLLRASFRDRAAGTAAMYYLRAELTEPVRGRPPRVWSSPVWVAPPAR
jgi:hypothetical protein